jgi:hypothetical protein
MGTELKTKIKRWISLRAEECKTVVPLYSYALDRKLTVVERLRFRFHLMTCNACTNYVENINFMREVFRTHDAVIDSDENHVSLRPDARDRLKKAISDANP